MRYGIYCPGCGGTRALIALMEGDPYQSLRYNPVTCLLLLDAFLTMLFAVIKRATKGKYMFIKFRLIYHVAFLLFVVVYFVVRNYLWIVHGVDLLGDMS